MRLEPRYSRVPVLNNSEMKNIFPASMLINTKIRQKLLRSFLQEISIPGKYNCTLITLVHLLRLTAC